jgi:hypothetical protein
MSTLRAVAGDPEQQRKWDDYAGRLTTEGGSEARRFEVSVLSVTDRIAREMVEAHKKGLDIHAEATPFKGADAIEVCENVIKSLVLQRMALDRVTTVAPKCTGCGFSAQACTCLAGRKA